MTLFVAETNDRVRHRLASIAASVEGIEVVGEAGEVGEAVGGIKRAKPDSVIVALPMSGGTGIDVLSAAKFSNPTSVALMLIQSPCNECRRKCFALGADHFFEKSSETKQIITTLVLLAHGFSRQKTGGESETNTSDVCSLLNPLGRSHAGLSSAPESCPRLAEFSASKNTVCFLAGDSDQTTYARNVRQSGSSPNVRK